MGKNFWGDMDGDGKQTPWDDMLGDMILHDALQAQERARRNLPPEDGDEELLGYRRSGPYASYPSGGVNPTLVGFLFVGALILAFLCLIGSLH
jgi:hypothetical protein